MFRSECLQQIIEFKWNTIAFKFHLLGTVIHFLYLSFLFAYILIAYIFDLGNKDIYHQAAIAFYVLAAYPTIYELI